MIDVGMGAWMKLLTNKVHIYKEWQYYSYTGHGMADKLKLKIKNYNYIQ